MATEHLSYDDVALPLDELFWISRRAGLLLAFAAGYTAAFRASDARLKDLTRAIEGRLDLSSIRAATLAPFAAESIICSAGVAVSGTEARGLHLAVFTRRALHLLARDRAHHIPWPVSPAREVADPARPARPALELGSGTDLLRLLYLLPEEISAILEVAEVPPSEPPPSQPEEREAAIEMFARREVAGPTPARLPNFTTSTESIREHAERQAATVPNELHVRVRLADDFFVHHYQELAETALGPLLFRKSAASRARSLAKAVEAMDAEALQDDARAASLNSLGRLAEAYDREVRRLLQGKRRAQKLEAELAMSEALRESLRGRFLAPLHGLAPQLQRLERAQADLLVRLERLEAGPPEAEESELDEAAREWHGALVAVDRDFATAGRELLEEIGVVWSSTLLPQLVKAADAPRQRVPEWVKLVVIGLITTLVVATGVLLWRG